MALERNAANPRRPASRGSVTLASLCLLTTLGIALTSYLALTTRSAQFSNRGLNQEKAQQLAQIGLEEALWALNQNTWTGSGPDGTTAWGLSNGTRTATLTYNLSGQRLTGQVVLSVANYDKTGPLWPIVTSTATVTLQSGEKFTKAVQATTGPTPLFGNAIASSDSYVRFDSTGTVDSWDSKSGTIPYSFSAGAAANYTAVVAGRTDGSTYGVILNQATIRGYVATSGLPVQYSTSGSPAAKVLGPTTAAAVNVDASRLGKSAFVPLDDVFSVTIPSLNVKEYTLGDFLLALLGGILNLPAGYDACRIKGDLKIDPHFLINPNPNITINKKIQVIVDGDLIIMGNGRLTIESTGSLQLFVKGNVTIEGNGILNETKDPAKLAIFCTSSSSTEVLKYNTTEDFYGVIFCENKPIEILKKATFYGALLSRQKVHFKADTTFHYDSSLRTTRFAGVTTPYIVTKVTDL